LPIADWKTGGRRYPFFQSAIGNWQSAISARPVDFSPLPLTITPMAGYSADNPVGGPGDFICFSHGFYCEYRNFRLSPPILETCTGDVRW
jgi:hypothetical protein